MSLWKNYYLAQSISDALDKISDGARVIAGGTDLLLEIKHGIQPPVESLVDVCNIPELNALEIQGDNLFIGAAVPLNVIVSSPLINENSQVSVKACNLIGGPQVRNTATLGGNVAHALSAADGTIALFALGSHVEAVGSNGARLTHLEELFADPVDLSLKRIKSCLLDSTFPIRSPDRLLHLEQ
jgi:CO/xanthine dehydrogenase FAD-binding subunit